MSKIESYFSDKLGPEDIDLSWTCYRMLVNEHEKATYIFLGEKPRQPNIFDGELMYFCDGTCQYCECDHCKKTFMEG